MSRITAFAVALAVALSGLARPGAASDTVVLQLHGPAQFEFAGYYAALWKGFYKDAGISIDIQPGTTGKNSIDPVRELAEGRAQFGTGTMQLVVRAAQGLPLIMVAPIFQESGSAVYYRADTDFSSPAALLKAKLGRLPASDILDIELATALRAEGIDPARIKSVNIDQSQIVPALADKTIDAAIGSAWLVPWQAHEKGIVLKSFNPANYRVEYYGDSLFTSQRYAMDHPDTVAQFRTATLKGWEYALQHPEEISQRLVFEPPSPPPVGDPAGFARYQIDVARRLARYPDIALGYSNLDRWTQIEAGMLGAGVLTRSADLTSFVYVPPGTAAASKTASGAPMTVLRYLLALLAAIAVLGWVGLSLWQKRPRQKGEAEAGAAGTLAPVVDIATPVQSPKIRRAALRRSQQEPVAEPTTPEIPPAPPLPPPIDLNGILSPLERRIRQKVRGKVRFRYSLLPELWLCRTEGGPLAAIVLDLVEAATTAMDADGSLIVGTRNIVFDETNVYDYPGAQLGEFARITVRDSGPALTEEEFNHAFEPGVSARPAISRAAATVGRIGGYIRVESAEGIGTAVHLYFARVTEATVERLPVAPPPAAEVAE